MQRVTPDRPWPLHDLAGSRAAESRAAMALPAHTLMERAGLSVAKLALAVAPHSRSIWIACGPGNNGGDGFETARHLKQWGKAPVVTWAGDAAKAPPDALASLRRLRDAGVDISPDAPAAFDFGIDAMLGLGAGRAMEGTLAHWATALGAAPSLAVDLPSGLGADTGTGGGLRATHTLSLLTLKPGLFTGSGRDHAGTVWFDDLGASHDVHPTAWLTGPRPDAARSHDSHKGRHGDVAVIGGAAGMTGAALLAGSAALHAGAGRVFVALLAGGPAMDPHQPELMLRDWASLDLSQMAVACGCGGGDAVRAALPRILATARELVLDADALNAVAADPQLQSLLQARNRRGAVTVLTPHPLEAARLLSITTAEVQQDRLRAAQVLAGRYGGIVVLKGSGTVTAASGRAPFVNPTGNGRLATGGTGDVLAGLIAARIHLRRNPMLATAQAAFEHGELSDRWPGGSALTAGRLAGALRP